MCHISPHISALSPRPRPSKREDIMESSPQEDAEGQAIVKVLAVVLERLVSANSHLDASQVDETKFHALRAPAIGIHQYLERYVQLFIHVFVSPAIIDVLTPHMSSPPPPHMLMCASASTNTHPAPRNVSSSP